MGMGIVAEEEEMGEEEGGTMGRRARCGAQPSGASSNEKAVGLSVRKHWMS